MSAERLETLQRLETELHAHSTRTDRVRLEELLHAEFVEIGRSGRLWRREDSILALLAESEHPFPETADWEMHDVGPDLVMLTYRVISPASGSRHASLWDLSGPRPRLRYHQGTRIAEA